jgi:superfamily I DNA/RNA helicase
MEKSIVQPWNEGVKGTQVLPLINSDEQLIRVEAGPGTGKTFGLVRRVIRLLHPNGLNVPGGEVLIVAFNRVIAKQLKSDITAALSKSPHTGEPTIRTVHALCLEIIGGELRLLMPHEREAMIYDVLHEHPALQETYNRHNKAEQALRDHEAKHADHTTLWQAVEQWLKRHKARLISDLPGMLLDRMMVGDGTAQTYSHVIADEFQDLTHGEQDLFARMRSEGGSFVALGDPRQSIYKFRGNDLNGLSNLEKMLNVTPDDISNIEMTECQRCPGDVVKAANQLMALYGAIPMVLDPEKKANTHVVVWKSPEQEAAGMAKAIATNVAAYPDEDHLVMVTRRQFGFMLRDEIAKINPDLRIDLSFSESLLETWAVREAFLLFCLLVDPDAATWRAWLAYQNNLAGDNFKAAKRNAEPYLNALGACGDIITESVIRELADGSRKVKGTGSQKIADRAKRYMELKSQIGTIGDVAEEVVNRIFNIAEWVEKDAPVYTVAATDMGLANEKVHALLAEIQASPKAPETALDQLRTAARSFRYDIAVREPFSTDGAMDLQVTTLWSAKGVTADHVYVIGLTEQTIPGKRRDEYPGTDAEHREEQRRLFYVSITRSKKTLVLSRSDRIKRTEAARLGLPVAAGNSQIANLDMCPFLRDIIRYLPPVTRGEQWAGCSPLSDVL